MGYLYTPRYCYISPLCFTARRRLEGHHPVQQPPVCRIPKSGAITQEVQETLRDQDGVRKWTVSQPAVGASYIRMSRQWTPRGRGRPAMGPLSESLRVYILTLTNKSNTPQAVCVSLVKAR